MHSEKQGIVERVYDAVFMYAARKKTQMKVSLSVFRKRIVWCCLAIVGVFALIVMQMLWTRRGYQAGCGLQSYMDIKDSWTYENGSPEDLSSLKPMESCDAAA